MSRPPLAVRSCAPGPAPSRGTGGASLAREATSMAAFPTHPIRRSGGCAGSTPRPSSQPWCAGPRRRSEKRFPATPATSAGSSPARSAAPTTRTSGSSSTCSPAGPWPIWASPRARRCAAGRRSAPAPSPTRRATCCVARSWRAAPRPWRPRRSASPARRHPSAALPGRRVRGGGGRGGRTPDPAAGRPARGRRPVPQGRRTPARRVRAAGRGSRPAVHRGPVARGRR